MKILALDTSTDWLTVAVGLTGDGTRHWCVREMLAAGQTSGQILPLVEQTLAEAGISLTGLDGIAVGAGPGSFTGVRIACGVAQGLALGTGLPLVQISSLEAVAEQAYRDHGWQQVLVGLDARMQEVYSAALVRANDAWQPLLPMSVGKAEELREAWGRQLLTGTWYGAGDALKVEPLLTQYCNVYEWDATIRPTALAIGEVALARFACGTTLTPEQLSPFYIRNRVALTIKQRLVGERL